MIAQTVNVQASGHSNHYVLYNLYFIYIFILHAHYYCLQLIIKT